MIKIVSLNIEFNKHFSTVIPFIKKENPDVLLAQEVLEEDLQSLSESFGMQYQYSPMAIIKFEESEKVIGIAIFTKHPILENEVAYYYGDPKNLPISDRTDPDKNARPIIIVTIEKDGTKYCLANTHFTWSPGGESNTQQKQNLDDMLKILSKFSDFVLCGDFNAPRGREIFDKLTELYIDNIPKNITTTIDKNLHKAGDLQLVVDGLFTTKGYKVENVRVVDGISDHMAIVAIVNSEFTKY